jgi:signal transduction histidine kinase
MAARERAEANLHQIEQLKLTGRLTGGVAHEFNNILAVVVGNLDLVIGKLTGADPSIQKWAHRAMSAALRGKDLTEKLLTYASNRPLEAERQDIGKVIKGAVPLFAATVDGATEFNWSVEDELWPVVTDRSVLESALLNLVLNANQAVTGPGSVQLRALNMTARNGRQALTGGVTPGDYVAIEVRDDGAGMEPEVLRQAVQPFFTTHEVGEGTGLGLSMVYGFAQQGGGHLEIESERGLGTTVRILLPRAQPQNG